MVQRGGLQPRPVAVQFVWELQRTVRRGACFPYGHLQSGRRLWRT